MADSPPYPGTPRWVKVFGIIAIVLILLFVILLLTGRSRHGPGSHTGSGGSGGYTPPVMNMASNGHDHNTPPAQVRAHRACHVLGRLARRSRCIPSSCCRRLTGQDAQTVRAA